MEKKTIMLRYYYYRYRYILLLFLFLLVFGLKVSPPSAPLTDRNIFQLNEEQHRFILFNKIPTIAGKKYRITFSARLAPKDVLRTRSTFIEEPRIALYRSAELITTTKLLTTTLRSVGDWQYHTVEFMGSGYEENFYVEKEKSAGALLIALRPLTISSLFDEGPYRTTVFGEGKSEQIFAIGDKDTNVEYKRVAGLSSFALQPLPERLTNIASIELLVSQTGFGGSGKYKISIRDINPTEDRIVVGEEIFTLSFSTADLLSYSLGENWYRFPVTAVLEPEKQYGLIIDSSEVRTSPFHFLSFGLVPASSSSQQMYLLRNTSKLNSPLSSQLAMKLYARKPTILQGSAMLEGQVLEDRGESLLMTYEAWREPTHLLDLSNIMVGKNYTGPLYSEKNKRVEMKVTSDASYEYKLPLGGQLIRAEVAYTTTSPASPDIRISYSLDGQNWSSLDPEQWALSGLVRKQITGSGSIIWIRVSYLPNTGTDAVFGLDQLRVVAEVKK
jgi:hypothetical protein